MNNYKQLEFDIKTYWKITGIASIFGILTCVAAYYDNSWFGLPLGIITVFLFLLLRACTITKRDAVVSGEEQ